MQARSTDVVVIGAGIAGLTVRMASDATESPW